MFCVDIERVLEKNAACERRVPPIAAASVSENHPLVLHGECEMPGVQRNAKRAADCAIGLHTGPGCWVSQQRGTPVLG